MLESKHNQAIGNIYVVFLVPFGINLKANQDSPREHRHYFSGFIARYCKFYRLKVQALEYKIYFILIRSVLAATPPPLQCQPRCQNPQSRRRYYVVIVSSAGS